MNRGLISQSDSGYFRFDTASVYNNFMIQTNWYRNSMWAKNFSAWLRYANELYPMTWKGGFIRAMYDTINPSYGNTRYSKVRIIDSNVQSFNIVESHEGRGGTIYVESFAVVPHMIRHGIKFSSKTR